MNDDTVVHPRGAETVADEAAPEPKSEPKPAPEAAGSPEPGPAADRTVAEDLTKMFYWLAMR